jgi:hypothetical protein
MLESLYQFRTSTVALYAGIHSVFSQQYCPNLQQLVGKMVKRTMWCYFQNVAHDLIHCEVMRIQDYQKLQMEEFVRFHISCNHMQLIFILTPDSGNAKTLIASSILSQVHLDLFISKAQMGQLVRLNN